MIIATQQDQVGYLTLDRPDKLNALSTPMLEALGSAVHDFSVSDVRVIVVRSSSIHFSAGADLAEWATPTATEAHHMSRVGVDAFAALAAISVPTIAAITGVAAGGGLELALACDLRIASRDSRLGLPETGLANLPSYGGINRLVTVVGAARARELLFTAELIGADRAERIGLVNWVFDEVEFDERLSETVGQIAAADPRAVAIAKALTGEAPLDGLLSTFTSQTEESRARKLDFLKTRATAKSRARSKTFDGN